MTSYLKQEELTIKINRHELSLGLSGECEELADECYLEDTGNFRDGDYTGTTAFQGKNLSFSSFEGADLTDVSFKGSNLVGVDFTGAILNNTDFTYAKDTSWCDFTDVDMTNVKGIG